MNSPEKNTHPDRAAREAAADWVLRIETEPDMRTSEAFERWLHADPSHVEAFNAAANIWDESAALSPPVSSAPRSSRYSNGHGWSRIASSRRFQIAGLAAAACLAAVLSFTLLRSPASVPVVNYETPVGQISSFELADGSVLHLDTNSRVETIYSADRRRVDLIGGRVFVDVMPDPSKPFEVVAQGVSFTAVGTAYSVSDAGGGIMLEVYEGTVGVSGFAPDSIHVTAGRGAHISGDGLSMFDLRGSLKQGLPDWTSGRVVFDATPIPAAIESFQRYTDKRIVLRDGSAADLKVGGTFSLTDVDSFIDSLELIARLEAEVTDGEIILTSSESQ